MIKRMDEQIEKTLKIFYGYPNGFTTEDFYEEYIEACIADEVIPRVKSTVIREVCKATGLKVRAVQTHYFVEGVTA